MTFLLDSSSTKEGGIEGKLRKWSSWSVLEEDRKRDISEDCEQVMILSILSVVVFVIIDVVTMAVSGVVLAMLFLIAAVVD